jgi:hypothetical protein
VALEPVEGDKLLAPVGADHSTHGMLGRCVVVTDQAGELHNWPDPAFVIPGVELVGYGFLLL